ncbi:LTA synthase family protein [Flagellimonas ruestringensis]|nr:LTA synthase family protein [Allomuricauda ruestringensis]
MLLFFILELVFIFYYKSSLVLLGADLFSYSLGDIIQTVGSSGSIFAIVVLAIIIVSLFSMWYLWSIPRKIKLNLKPAIQVVLCFALLSIGHITQFKSQESAFEKEIVTNKTIHFVDAAHNYFSTKEVETDIYADSYLINTISSKMGKRLTYLQNTDFPFLHKSVEEDVLSPFFKTDSISPNIVFILVEGLGRAFSGEDAYLKSFTPFLDSLSQQGLYWKNTLSNTGRTFGVLPSILGALPFAENGYLDLGAKMPQQLSLLNLLKPNGYRTSFYYGGNASFDQMDLFLQQNNIDFIFDESSFDKRYKKLPSSSNFSWGYGDRELYAHYFETKEKIEPKPSLDIILTLTSHSPFQLNDHSKYLKLFEDHLNNLALSEASKDKYRIYADQYATILYADASLKWFISEYEKRDVFRNTIFIITGDHRLPEIPMRNKIDRYHVPLIIYSPMLKKTSTISSVSSHFDIAPSLYNFLANRYQYGKPSMNSWLGYGLDTLQNYRNLHVIPLMQTKADLLDIVVGTYHLNYVNLYQMDQHLDETPIENESIKLEVQAIFEAFKRRNNQVSKLKSMIPDSILRTYSMPQ